MDTSEHSAFVERSMDPAGPLPGSPVHVRNLTFTLLSAAVVILLLQHMQPVLLPLVLGALLFYALDPAVDRLQRLRVPSAVGAALMLFIVVASCGAGRTDDAQYGSSSMVPTACGLIGGEMCGDADRVRAQFGGTIQFLGRSRFPQVLDSQSAERCPSG